MKQLELLSLHAESVVGAQCLPSCRCGGGREGQPGAGWPLPGFGAAAAGPGSCFKQKALWRC